MPYEFQEWEEEPQPEASCARSGGPPRKSIAIGVLDPAGHPKGPSEPRLLGFFLTRIVAILILAGLALMLLYRFLAR